NITSTGGGQVFYGSNGIIANGPANSLNALGRNVVFSTGTLPATAITLNGNVTITADPPVTGVESTGIVNSDSQGPSLTPNQHGSENTKVTPASVQTIP